jgi:hypothetical protein
MLPSIGYQNLSRRQLLSRGRLARARTERLAVRSCRAQPNSQANERDDQKTNNDYLISSQRSGAENVEQNSNEDQGDDHPGQQPPGLNHGHDRLPPIVRSMPPNREATWKRLTAKPEYYPLLSPPAIALGAKIFSIFVLRITFRDR